MFAFQLLIGATAFLRANKLDGKDEFCKTGIMEASSESPRVCCPAFCSECSAYESCTAAFEHDTDKSKNACCADVVKEHSCDNAGENGLTPVSFPPCVKPCTESLPPCLMTDSDFVFDPSALEYDAAADCGEVIYEWEQTSKAMTEGLSEAGPKLLQESRKDGVTKQCGRAKKDGKCLCKLTRADGATIGVVHEK
jgi:hypothetical protein